MTIENTNLYNEILMALDSFKMILVTDGTDLERADRMGMRVVSGFINIGFGFVEIIPSDGASPQDLYIPQNFELREPILN